MEPPGRDGERQGPLGALRRVPAGVQARRPRVHGVAEVTGVDRPHRTPTANGQGGAVRTDVGDRSPARPDARCTEELREVREREANPPARRRRCAVVALRDGPQVREWRAPEDLLVRVCAAVGGREVHRRGDASVLQEDLPIGPAHRSHPSPVGRVGWDRDPAVHLAGGGGADRLVEALPLISAPARRRERVASSGDRLGLQGRRSATRAEPPRSLRGSGRTAAPP